MGEMSSVTAPDIDLAVIGGSDRGLRGAGAKDSPEQRE